MAGCRTGKLVAQPSSVGKAPLKPMNQCRCTYGQHTRQAYFPTSRQQQLQRFTPPRWQALLRFVSQGAASNCFGMQQIMVQGAPRGSTKIANELTGKHASERRGAGRGEQARGQQHTKGQSRHTQPGGQPSSSGAEKWHSPRLNSTTGNCAARQMCCHGCSLAVAASAARCCAASTAR